MAAAPVFPNQTPEPAPLSQGARIVNTFVAPSKTFADLRRDASWWAPWLVITIFALTFGWVVSQQIGFEQVTRYNIAHSANADKFDQMPADQQTKAIGFWTGVTRILTYGSPLIVLVYFLVVGAVLMGTFKIVGGNVPFATSFAIVAYSSLPGIIHTTLAMVTMFAGLNREAFDINNPVGTNLAYYMDPATSNKFLRGMASIDVIMLWSLVLMGIGFACNSKVKRGTAIGIVLGWYLVWKLATSALAAAF